jgi:regulator of replication initiation timing
MPLIERDQFEGLLTELLNSELEHSRRTEILQELRVAQGNAYSEFDEHSKKLNKLEKDNSDLILSNSKLFRQLGNTEPEQKKKEVEKEFSETVTIEQFEKGE